MGAETQGARGARHAGPRRRQEKDAGSTNYLERFKKSYPDRFTVKIIDTMSLLTARTGFTVPPQTSLVRELFRDYGTSGTTAYSAMTGDMPVKNWDGVGFKEFPIDRAAKTSDESVVARQKKRYACQSCPLGCGGIVEITKGRYAGTEGHKAEYETLAAFGGLLLHDDLDAIMELNELCNRAGIDTISAGGTVAFAIECYQRGIIDKKKTGGLELAWGDGPLSSSSRLIIQRKGIVFCRRREEGGERIGKGSESTMHAGAGASHATRARTSASAWPTSASRRPNGTISSFLYSNLYRTKKFPAAARMMRRAGRRREKWHYAASSAHAVMNGCGMCIFRAADIEPPGGGVDQRGNRLGSHRRRALHRGERILSMRKAFNVARSPRRGPAPPTGRRASRRSPRTLKGITADMNHGANILRPRDGTASRGPHGRNSGLGIGRLFRGILITEGDDMMTTVSVRFLLRARPSASGRAFRGGASAGAALTPPARAALIQSDGITRNGRGRIRVIWLNMGTARPPGYTASPRASSPWQQAVRSQPTERRHAASFVVAAYRIVCRGGGAGDRGLRHRPACLLERVRSRERHHHGQFAHRAGAPGDSRLHRLDDNSTGGRGRRGAPGGRLRGALRVGAGFRGDDVRVGDSDPVLSGEPRAIPCPGTRGVPARRRTSGR